MGRTCTSPFFVVRRRILHSTVQAGAGGKISLVAVCCCWPNAAGIVCSSTIQTTRRPLTAIVVAWSRPLFCCVIAGCMSCPSPEEAAGLAHASSAHHHDPVCCCCIEQPHPTPPTLHASSHPYNTNGLRVRLPWEEQAGTRTPPRPARSDKALPAAGLTAQLSVCVCLSAGAPNKMHKWLPREFGVLCLSLFCHTTPPLLHLCLAGSW